MILIAVDPGISGGIATFETDAYGTLVLRDAGIIPTIKIETKPRRDVLDLKDGKKQYYKTGLKKNQVKMKMKSAAKYRKKLNVGHIHNRFKEADIIVIENQNTRPGNSAASSAETMKNFGKLLALAEILPSRLVMVQPAVWKKHFNLTVSKKDKKSMTPTMYKKMSIRKAYDLTSWNTSYDGISDSIVIGCYAIEREQL